MDERFYLAVMELINAYERGLILSLNKVQTETTPKILMMNQLITMEAAVETGELGFGLSVAEIAKLIKEEKENTKVYEPVDKKKKSLFFQECTIDGKQITNDSSLIANKFESQVEVDFNDMYSYTPKKTPKLNFKYKATNDFKYNLDFIKNKNISKYLDDNLASFDSNGDGIPDKVNIFGWKTNFGLEKCLDCFIDFKLELHLPSLEWAFDFSKILGKIKNFLSKMNAALDPKGPMLGICALLEAIKNNGLCPKNLPPLALMLPSLFVKYSFDLLNIRLNLSGLFLPLIKTVLSALTSALENVPKIVNPILNCLINAFTGVNYLIKNYLSLGDKLVNQMISAADAVVNTPKNLKNTFIPTSDSLLDNLKPKEADKDLSDVKSAINKINSIKADRAMTYENKAYLLLIELLELVSKGVIPVETLNPAGNNFDEYCYFVSPDSFFRTDILFESNDPNSPNLNKFIENFQRLKDGDSALKEQAKRRESFAKLTSTPVKRAVGVSKIETINNLNKKIKESTDPFLATYGVENKVEYIPNDSITEFRSTMLRDYTTQNPINQFLEQVIAELKKAKKYVNDFIAGVINSVKALTVFVSETLDTDIQITGSILELMHLIRFVRLIWNLIKNGLTDCKKFKQNPALVNNIIKDVYNSNYDTIVQNPLNPSLNNPTGAFKEYLTITDTKTGKKMHIDPEECNSISSLNLSDAILDGIYSDLTKNYFTKG